MAKEKSPQTKTLEIIQNIAQACVRNYDGATDEEFNPLEIGLRREKPVGDSERRFIDGFKVSFTGNRMNLTYQSEIHLKEVYQKDFEGYIGDILGEIISFIKKEYKKITKKSLGLKMVKEPHVRVERMNRVRCWVIASCAYEIEGIDKPETMGKTWQDRLNDTTKKFLGIEK